MVSPTQEGFIHRRQLIENVLLATELVKGYGRCQMTPRYMVKMDLRKAYNSQDWSFMEGMLSSLGFPERFIKMVMACVCFVSYS